MTTYQAERDGWDTAADILTAVLKVLFAVELTVIAIVAGVGA